MSWLVFDDQILRHPKFVRAQRLAGSTAFHLWTGLAAYCKQRQSDGRVPADMIATVDGPDKRWRPRALKALVTVGLVEYEGADLWVHDFLDWNRSREEIEAKSAARRAGRAPTSGRQRTSEERRTERQRSVEPNVVGASNLELGDPNEAEQLSLLRKPSDSDSDSDSYVTDPPNPQTDPAPAAPASAPPIKKKPSTRLGKRLCPADFEPTPAVLKLATELGFTEQRERETRVEFVDYWLRRGELGSDWQAGYRNRLRAVAKREGLKPFKHDAQWAHHQAELRKAAMPATNAVPPPPEFAAKVRSLFAAS